jgi:RND family efflux transporter MFP subunit
MKIPKYFTSMLSSAVFLCAGVGLMSACSEKPAATPSIAPATSIASAPSGAASGPAVSVTTIRALQRDLPVLLNATGIVTSLSSVDVKPQVTSVITKVYFREGQFVKAGDMLFTLDSRADEANVAKARAQFVKDQAALADAQRQLARSKDLLAQNFISKAALDTSQTLVDSQAAVLVTDQAAIDVARVSLSNATIKAPSAGRVGAVNVFSGSAVQANLTTLVTITQLDPIAVTFSLPQRNLPDALAALQNGGSAVSATLPDSAGNMTGRLQFVDNAVDPSAGTVKVKAVFDNKQDKLWPGAFVDIGLTVRTLKEAVVIPQTAIIQAARGPMVYIAANGVATSRTVELVYSQGTDAAVKGVLIGEAVVVDGKQNLRTGASVVERAPKVDRAKQSTSSTASSTASVLSIAPAMDATSQPKVTVP